MSVDGYWSDCVGGMRSMMKAIACGCLNASMNRFTFVFLSFLCSFVVTAYHKTEVAVLLQSLARMNKKDSWLFWWTLYLTVSDVEYTIVLFLLLFLARNEINHAQYYSLALIYLPDKFSTNSIRDGIYKHKQHTKEYWTTNSSQAC